MPTVCMLAISLQLALPDFAGSERYYLIFLFQGAVLTARHANYCPHVSRTAQLIVANDGLMADR